MRNSKRRASRILGLPPFSRFNFRPRQYQFDHLLGDRRLARTVDDGSLGSHAPRPAGLPTELLKGSKLMPKRISVLVMKARAASSGIKSGCARMPVLVLMVSPSIAICVRKLSTRSAAPQACARSSRPQTSSTLNSRCTSFHRRRPASPKVDGGCTGFASRASTRRRGGLGGFSRMRKSSLHENHFARNRVNSRTRNHTRAGMRGEAKILRYPPGSACAAPVPLPPDDGRTGRAMVKASQNAHGRRSWSPA